MHVGMATIFQNPGRERRDYDVYKDDLRLADQAEGLGFESLWSVEHHFTDYTMVPDVVQFLTYMAGRTTHAKLGSMVIVLPWHDPMRVAEQVAMLDNIADGRMILGLGRGLGRIEFEGFRLDMTESRPMFTEYAQMLLEGLEQGYCEFDGEHIKQPRRDIRPEPLKSFKGRTYAAAVSPESAHIMAKLGIGLLIIPQKPWSEVAKDLDDYRGIYVEVNQAEPPPPIAAGWTFCDESEERAYEMARRYIGGYYESVMEHYEFKDSHLKGMKGYEYYGKMQDKIAKYGADDAIDFFMNLQVWGTPEQCYERIVKINEKVANDSFVGVFSYAGMPYDEANRNMHLFAKEVMPELKKLNAEPGRKAASA